MKAVAARVVFGYRQQIRQDTRLVTNRKCRLIVVLKRVTKVAGCFPARGYEGVFVVFMIQPLRYSAYHGERFEIIGRMVGPCVTSPFGGCENKSTSISAGEYAHVVVCRRGGVLGEWDVGA